MRYFIFAFLVIGFGAMTACTTQQPAPTGHDTILAEVVPSLAATQVVATMASPTAVSTAIPSPLPSPTQTPTATPSPTAVPVITLFIPAEWQAIAPEAIAQLNQTAPSYQWQAATSEQEADIRLSNTEVGILVLQEPLALVVPFNAGWDYTDQATAQGIIDSGHQLAKVMPWRDINRTQKAMHIDGRFPTDADYPFHENWSLVGQTDSSGQAVSLAAPLFQDLMADNVIHLAAVGDIMLDRTLGHVIADGGIHFPFKLVAEPLQNADITVGNLETSLGDIGEPVVKSYTFQSPPAAAEALAWGGFDVVSLANNHALDYGPEALLQGIDLLNAQQVAPIGAGANAAQARAPHIMSVNGLDIAFLGYIHVPVEARGTYFDTATWTATETTPGLAWAVPEEIRNDVTAVKPLVDLVVVVLHSGYEYVEPPSQEQTDAAQAAIDAGADIVIGHHAHILQGVQFYKEGVIVYGLGNFAFNIDGNPDTAILNVWLDKDGVRQFEFIPAIVQYGGQPRFADAEESSRILSQIYRLSQAFPMPVR